MKAVRLIIVEKHSGIPIYFKSTSEDDKEYLFSGVMTAIGAINVLGWGVYTIQILDNDRLEICIKNSYEGDAYVRRYGPVSGHGVCYLAVGASIAIMSLIHQAGIENKIELDEELYDRLFKRERMFDGVETNCIAKGDTCCRINIRRL